eukprot:3041451-Rhodomonas_salina.1
MKKRVLTDTVCNPTSLTSTTENPSCCAPAFSFSAAPLAPSSAQLKTKIGRSAQAEGDGREGTAAPQ